MRRDLAQRASSRLLVWSAVFAVNLIVPLLWAWGITRQGGRLGMAAAIVGWWSAGALACVRSRPWCLGLVLGGAAVAVSQLWPFLHLMAGMAGLNAVSRATGVQDILMRPAAPLSELGGFVATAVTGFTLLLVAVGSGMVLVTGLGPYLLTDEELGIGGEGSANGGSTTGPVLDRMDESSALS